MWNIWMAYTARRCSVEATYEALSRNPLDGSAQKWPTPGPLWQKKGGGIYGNEELTRLLDVGARSSDNDPTISFVPPLDRASPFATLWQDRFAMQFVLFDLQLVELKSVDAVSGSFQVEIQMVLHWIDSIINGSQGTTYTDDCRFPCDTKSPTPLCCDSVWVPPLHLPGCKINNIQSSTPEPYIHSWSGEELSYSDCFKVENEGDCVWRRLWYLNIDATCASDMDFHNFPFDVQRLTIDILNPHASRTWFQLTKGFLEANIGEDFNTVNLSPDAKIPGWYVKDLLVSGTCGTSKNWEQTFLVQDNLLKILNGTYASQEHDIQKALDPKVLTCSIMEDINNGSGDIDFSSPTSYIPYQNVRKKYEERFNTTLETYKQCTQTQGEAFYWNLSSYDEVGNISIPNFGTFYTSTKNINRSFNILDLVKQDTMARVSFPCAISAIANLTTPGIQVTIVVQRYRLFYVVKLILPTIACVAFSFAAFGLHPKDLVGRLTVVVPSAIALTALQGLVVSTDIPPVAYIAPSTYIFLLSYLVQIFISFESILVSSLYSRRELWRTLWSTMCKRKLENAPSMNEVSNQPYERFNSEENRRSVDRIPDTQPTHDMSVQLSIMNNDQESSRRIEGGPAPEIANEMSSNASHRSFTYSFFKMDCTRVLDFVFMSFLVILYITAVWYCTIKPLTNSEWLSKQTSNTHVVDLWT